MVSQLRPLRWPEPGDYGCLRITAPPPARAPRPDWDEAVADGLIAPARSPVPAATAADSMSPKDRP